MTLIKSISGIRGTIGGKSGNNLTPNDIVKFTTAYAKYIASTTLSDRSPVAERSRSLKIVVGRDARISGAMVDSLVCGTLIGCGCDVVNIGLASTPTTEIAVTAEGADGGIIITASHNPKQWNALKLLNSKGEFLNKEDGEKVLQITESEDTEFATVDNLGQMSFKDFSDYHINNVLSLDLVDVEAIRNADFSVAIDCVNSVGGIIIPQLLEKLGVTKITKLNCEPTGNFAHNPEPLKENLTEISEYIAKNKVDVGFVVDPDVDRLAIVCEDGEMFGEEYTLVSVADYVLSHTKGNTVSNLSSTRALRDVTEKHGGQYAAAAVGEVNVVEKMKAINAVIGGEGNGGVIYPASHYGRDALVGIALFLTNLAKKKLKVSELRKTYPEYFISKNKIELTPDIDVDGILAVIKGCYKQYEINDIDGVKIDFPQGWVHLRKSNTEPIIRIYSEAPTPEQADKFAQAVIDEIKRISGSIQK
ncbi:MAG: phosphoglucosamine mutase [Prevotellaceae bacterium]|jgi:phosphomannomutase|nr:phosphoglucosamine mutase [Prevotellaceae bacterium]